MLKPEDSKNFKNQMDRLKDVHSELLKIVTPNCPPHDVTLLNLGLSRLRDTLKCFDLISCSSNADDQ